MFVIYILGALILFLLIAAYLMPATYRVEKNIIIERPLPLVRTRIADLNYYSQWNPWQQSDPTSKQTVTGTAGRPGHRYSWEGKKVGVGSLTLQNANDRHVHFELEFVKPWKSKASDNWAFEEWGDGSQTKVIWQNSGGLPWPIARLMGPLIQKNLHHQFETGLQNLKKMCEEQPG
jgi:hypothetical protein